MRSWIAALLPLVWLSIAHAETYGRDGYSVCLPDGWTTLDKGNPHALQDYCSICGLTSDQVRQLSCVALSPDSNATFAVASVPGAMPVDQAMLQQFIQEGRGRLSRLGVSALTGSIGRLAGRNALTFSCGSYRNGQPFRQWLIMVPAGRKTYIFACSSADQHWPRYEEEFKRILESAEISSFPTWLTVGAVAIAGGLLLAWMVRNRQARQAMQEQSRQSDRRAGEPLGCHCPPTPRAAEDPAFGPTLYKPPGG